MLSAVADQEILKWETMHQLRRHLSQMHIMNYARFIREKASCWKNCHGHCGGGGRPSIPSIPLVSATGEI